ncbi:MAG: alpha/beta hydrolase [Verrucomicrobiota bacterium]
MIKVVLGVFLLLGLGGALLLFRLQDFLIFPAKGVGYEFAPQQRDGIRVLTFQTRQGRQEAYYQGPSDPERLWILFAGNGCRSLDLEYLAQGRSNLGVGFLFVDFPGYGRCQGTPTPQGIVANGAKAFEALHVELQRDIPVENVGVFGFSLGGAAALMTANELGIRQAITVATFTSMQDMATLRAGVLGRLVRHRFSNREELRRFAESGGKLTAFHGTADQVVPYQMAKELREEAPGAVELLTLEGADHGSILDDRRILMRL